TCMHHSIEVVRGPIADACLRIGRDVRRVQRAERRGERTIAGKYSSARDRVAGDAITGLREIFAVLDLTRRASTLAALRVRSRLLPMRCRHETPACECRYDHALCRCHAHELPPRYLC